MKTIELPLSDEQEMLRSTSARFAQSSWPIASVRAGLGSDRVAEAAEHAKKAAQLGWYAMLVPDEYGGGSVSESGLSDASLISLERGRSLQPGPFIATNVVADALSRGVCGKELKDVVSTLVSGEDLACWTFTDPVPHGGLAPKCDGRPMATVTYSTAWPSS